jgi:hypothetical protein
MLALFAAPELDVELLKELAAVMREASICGLGQAAPNPLTTALTYFPQQLTVMAAPPLPLFPGPSPARGEGRLVSRVRDFPGTEEAR